MTSICAHAQLSSTDVCVDAQSASALLRGIMARMGKPASQREEDFRREVLNYLRALDISRQWSQSEMARRGGVAPSTINKAFKLKHSLTLSVLLLLEEQSGVPLPDSLLSAAKGRHSQGHATPDEVAAFLNSSPAWRRMIALGQQLAVESDPKVKAEIQREIQELVATVS